MTSTPQREPRRIRPACFVERTETVETLPDFETRMADQRHVWSQQGTDRFRNPDHDDVGDREWRAYAWFDRWILLGTRPVKRHRRKPMTMNRLFAGVRQAFGGRIASYVPVKLITTTDDLLRIGRGHPLAPPVRFPSLRPE